MVKPKNHNKYHGLFRFLLVLLVVLAYIGFAIYHYGVRQGIAVTALSWAFFVFATPIADAGFLIAFPIRLITKIRMLTTQIAVWIFGVMLVGGFLIFDSAVFQTTGLLRLFYQLLTTPWPLWLILALSAAGTFINIRFDDEVVDVATAKNKKNSLHRKFGRLSLTICLFAATIVLYVVLLHWTHTPVSIL